MSRPDPLPTTDERVHSEKIQAEIPLAALKAAEFAADGFKTWGGMNSAHEAYAVLLEEVDELWDHVKTKQKNRDLPAMKKEALQVAAMAIRFAVEICGEKRGRK